MATPNDIPPPGQSLEDWGQERDKARFAEHASLTRDLRAARASAREHEDALKDIRGRLDLYEAIKHQPRAVAEWTTPSRPDKHHAIPSLAMGDIHMDEHVLPAEMEGYNAYNREIALKRIERGFKKTIMLCRNYFAGVEYDGFQLFLPGDNISGIIHEELTETNIGTLCESILTVADPLEAGIRLLAEEFGKVNVTCVVGNHGRRTRKPRAKLRARDNFDWMVYQIIARGLQKHKGVSMQISEAPDCPVKLYDTRYRLTHGDQFRGGSGISAALSPLLLGTHRKAKKQQAVGQPYDVLVMGHWHTTLWLPTFGLIVNGSVIGYNEYAAGQNLAPELPQCSLWLTTPEHGITMQAPILVQDRSDEGW